MDLFFHATPVPPEKAVLVGGNRTWTREALQAEVAERARRRWDGESPGGIRPATLHPDPEGILDLLATWAGGGIAAPLSPQLTPAERATAMTTLAGTRASILPPGAAAILWTSGTSGSPRGVVLTEAGLLANVHASRDRLSLGPADVWYASLSLAHVGGLALVVRALVLGSTLLAEGAFDLGRVMAALKGDGESPPVTHVSLVPTQLLRVLDAWGEAPPPPALRCVLMGGAATPPDLLDRALNAGWPVALTYGMTEMTSQLCTAPPDRVREKPGSVGRPLVGNEVSIAVDGEILARGATLAGGFVGTDAPLVDSGGWYHTGDLGSLDVDGDLRVVGRKSDRIMSGGVTVDPHEVESVLRAHPALREACVVGIPDPEWGERVAAMVVPRDPEALSPGKWERLRRELTAWARDRLGAARLPRSWGVVGDLPLNRNGKVDREAVRATLGSATGP